MQPVKYLCCLAILFASCGSVRQTIALPADVNHLPIAYAVSPTALSDENSVPEPASAIAKNQLQQQDKAPEITMNAATPFLAKTNFKKVQSFSQLRAMAAAGEIKMSKRDVKILNKLDKKYGGDFKQFRADTFEFTTKAKIVAGVGAIGLLLAIFTGSWFGAFLFILAALGFILRFLGAIEF